MMKSRLEPERYSANTPEGYKNKYIFSFILFDVGRRLYNDNSR